VNCNKCEHFEQCEKSGKQPSTNKQSIKYCPDFQRHIQPNNNKNDYSGLNRFGLFECGDYDF